MVHRKGAKHRRVGHERTPRPVVTGSGEEYAYAESEHKNDENDVCEATEGHTLSIQELDTLPLWRN
jgi:hypothetical protein